MKVAEVVCTFPPYHGGMGSACLYSARELVKRGHEVTVFTLDYGRMTYSDQDFLNVVRLKTPLVHGDGGVAPQLYSLLKGFDVIHLHYPFYGSSEYVYLASLIRGQKYFMTYHSDVYGTNVFKKLAIGAYDRILLKGLIKRAGLVGALSLEHLKSTRAAELVDWDRVVEMPNGVDTEIYRPIEKDRSLLKKLGLEDKVVVLFVGNLHLCKGVDLLIEAIARIKDESIVLLVVGGGYEEKRFRELARRMGLEGRVIFVGPKSLDEGLISYYALADMFVLPSIYSESFGVVALEAMSCGKPVIVSSLPGPSRLVSDGKGGLIATVGDIEDLKAKIELLAYDENRRLEMGRMAREKAVEQYSWEKVGQDLEEFLIKITVT
jgi:glycosyltransferase involved in cell wall biosynthesis